MEHLDRILASKLPEITRNEFASGAPHRIPPKKLQSHLNVSFHRVPTAGGCSTALLARPTAQTPIKGLVILFHGLGDDACYPLWHWLPEICSKGHAVLSVDWDGHGVGQLTNLDFLEATRTPSLVIHALFGEDIPPCPVHLMGHSMGATLCTLASTQPWVQDRISGTVLISPALKIAPSLSCAREALTWLNPRRVFQDLLPRASLYGLLGLFPAFGRFRRGSFPVRLKTSQTYDTEARLFVTTLFEQNRLGSGLKKPVYWLHGLRDSIAPWAQISSFFSSVNCPLFVCTDEKRGHLSIAFGSMVPQFFSAFLG